MLFSSIWAIFMNIGRAKHLCKTHQLIKTINAIEENVDKQWIGQHCEPFTALFHDSPFLSVVIIRHLVDHFHVSSKSNELIWPSDGGHHFFHPHNELCHKKCQQNRKKLAKTRRKRVRKTVGCNSIESNSARK